MCKAKPERKVRVFYHHMISHQTFHFSKKFARLYCIYDLWARRAHTYIHIYAKIEDDSDYITLCHVTLHQQKNWDTTKRFFVCINEYVAQDPADMMHKLLLLLGSMIIIENALHCNKLYY